MIVWATMALAYHVYNKLKDTRRSVIHCAVYRSALMPKA